MCRSPVNLVKGLQILYEPSGYHLPRVNEFRNSVISANMTSVSYVFDRAALTLGQAIDKSSEWSQTCNLECGETQNQHVYLLMYLSTDGEWTGPVSLLAAEQATRVETRYVVISFEDSKIGANENVFPDVVTKLCG
jgi:hypothetical protein